MRKLITRLRAQRKFALAAEYAGVLADRYRRPEIRSFSFQAFRWPDIVDATKRPTPISTDVFLRVGKSFSEPLKPLTLTFAGELQKQGLNVDNPTFVTVRAGKAGVIHGVVKLDPTYHGAKTDFTLYVFVHQGRYYLLGFRSDSRYAARQRPLFAQIADRFGYL